MARFAIQWNQGGKDAFNVLDVIEGANGVGGSQPDPGGPALYDGDSVARKIGKTLMDTLEDRIATTCQLVSVTEQSASPVTAAIAVSGKNAGPALPINCAYMINKIPSSGRRGRMFVPGVVEAGVDEVGNHSTAVNVNFEADLSNWMWAMKREGIVMVVKRSNGTQSVVSNLVLAPGIGLQRDRLRR